MKTLTDEEAAKLVNDDDIKARRSPTSSRTASCSWTRSTRSRAARKRTAPTSRARACSATCCRWSRAPRVSTKYGMVRTDHILFIAQRRIPPVQALGSHSRAAGTISDPRRALVAVGCGFRADPDGDRRLPRRASTQALLATEQRRSRLPARRHPAPGRDRVRGQREAGEHRRPAAVHGDGAAARRGLVPRGQARPGRRSRSMRPTSTRGWRASPGTTTFRSYIL